VAPNGEITVNYSDDEVPATALACFELVGAAGHDAAINALAAAAERDEFSNHAGADANKNGRHDWRRRFAMAVALASHRRDGELRLRWLARLRASVCAEQRADGPLAGSWDGDAGGGRFDATAHAVLTLAALARPWQAAFSPARC